MSPICSYLIYGFLASHLHNIFKQVHDDHAQLLVEKFTVYNLSASHKHGILKWKGNYVHMILGATERNQGAMFFYVR